MVKSDNPPRDIEVRIRELSQLFDSLDPSPFVEKDLDPKAEEYIVESVRELPKGTAGPLVICLDQPDVMRDQEQVVGDAIREHFARQSRRLQRKLRVLIRRGFLSLAIGIAFLAAAFATTQAIRRLLGESDLWRVFEQGLLIVGWVAMWRPLEIFLYDWWPILGERRMYDRLSRMQVRIESRSEPPELPSRPTAAR
jgi:hypothetical protein